MKRNFKHCLYTVLFIVALSGCAGTSKQYVTISDVGTRIQDMEKGRVVVIRIEAFTYKAIGLKVSNEDATIGVLHNGGYLSWVREPGETKIKVTPAGISASTELSVTVEPGKTTYLSSIPVFNPLFAKFTLDKMDRIAGKNLLEKSKKPIKANEAEEIAKMKKARAQSSY